MAYNGQLKVLSAGKLIWVVETENQHFLFSSCIFFNCIVLSAINSLCCISSVFTVYVTIKPFLTFNQWQSCSALIIYS